MYNDRDPQWFNDKIRLLTKEKTTAYKYFRQNGKDAYRQHRLKVLQDRLNNSIESSKEIYYNRMLSRDYFQTKTNGISGDLLNILSDFLSNRKQRVVLNGQTSSCVIITAGVSQRSVLGPLLFLIYINDLPNGFTSVIKLFADDTSLFRVVHDINTSAKELDEDLNKISN